MSPWPPSLMLPVNQQPHLGTRHSPFSQRAAQEKYLEKFLEGRPAVQSGARSKSLASIHAKQIGASKVADANKAAHQVREGDLVFLDPPYSGVHYSRFYHVLETIARRMRRGLGRRSIPATKGTATIVVQHERRSRRSSRRFA